MVLTDTLQEMIKEMVAMIADTIMNYGSVTAAGGAGGSGRTSGAAGGTGIVFIKELGVM